MDIPTNALTTLPFSVELRRMPPEFGLAGRLT
jgi:hypothetical protein